MLRARYKACRVKIDKSEKRKNRHVGKMELPSFIVERAMVKIESLSSSSKQVAKVSRFYFDVAEFEYEVMKYVSHCNENTTAVKSTNYR